MRVSAQRVNAFVRRNASRTAAQNGMRKFSTAQHYMDLEDKYGAHNYAPIPVVLNKGQGTAVWDVDGKEYLDFLAAYSAVNQGHSHPRLLRVLQEQASQLTLTSRAFYNNRLGPYEKFITELLGYDRVLPMNTGVEGGETAVKLARRWGYDVKGVPQNQAEIVFPNNNFWGRTISAVSASDDPDAFGGYGPLLPGFRKVPYGDIDALRTLFENNPNIVGYMLEPIQGEAGVIIPPEGYLKAVRDLCTKHRVLMIADEVQTGLGRTGRLLACNWEDVRPDILILGKALSGGIMPVSAVLADDEVMLNIRPGQHGSTFGGNPLACVVAEEALRILVDEKLPENSDERGAQFRAHLEDIVRDYPGVFADEAVRGRGLMNALEVRPDAKNKQGKPITAWELCLGLANAQKVVQAPRGVLAKPTHNTIIRFSPPLVISEKEVDEAADTLSKVMKALVEGEPMQ